jgi:hypothetical protein
MSDAPTAPEGTAESPLRQELARGDAVLASVTPVLRHLLAADDHALFDDEVIARLKGMRADLARQLAVDEGPLANVDGLLAHLHALALEAQLAERLSARLGLDPVLSPLLQALIASPDGAIGALAMQALAAQARFVRLQRQMRLPLGELPADLLDRVLALAEADAAARIRAGYDEAAGRLSLLARLIHALGGGALAALTLDHAGLALFAGALAAASSQTREATVLSLQQGQATRLALALRAAGLKFSEIEADLVALQPHGALPEGLADISADQAAALLR